jgi:hypothetical protein
VNELLTCDSGVDAVDAPPLQLGVEEVVAGSGLAVALDAKEEARLIDGTGVRSVHMVFKQPFPDTVADTLIGTYFREYCDDVVMYVKDGGADVCEDEGAHFSDCSRKTAERMAGENCVSGLLVEFV